MAKNTPLDFDIVDAESATALLDLNAKGFVKALLKRAKSGDTEAIKMLLPRMAPLAEKDVGEDAALIAAFGTNDVQRLRRYVDEQ